MDLPKSLRARWWKWIERVYTATEGVQIVELAVALPLVTAMFVATYDFGQAFNVKQKLVSAAREGARFSANQSTSDLTTGTANTCPTSVCAVRDVIDQYLINSNISDCGLPSATVAQVNSPHWTWAFTATGCPGTNLVVTVDRGHTYTETVASGSGNVTVTVESTQVTIAYPYRWHINRVMQILAPGSSYAAVSTITATAVIQNLN